MANTANNAARKPAAAATVAAPTVKAVAVADAKALYAARLEKLANALKGIAYPAPDNGAAWVAMLAEVPAVAEMLADAPANKYGANKGLVPAASTMLANTANVGAAMASGIGKNGKPNCQAAVCMATALACEALKAPAVCKGAVVFFMLTDSRVLAILRASKAAATGNGGPRYLSGSSTPCPAWAGGYVNGNVRGDMLKVIA